MFWLLVLSNTGDRMAKKDTDLMPIEADIVAPNNSPRAVMVSPAQLRKQMKRDQDMRGVINEYIKNNMVEGKDFGSITVEGKTTKPSLFKPGGEKFCGLFKISPTFKKDTETVEMLGNTPGIIAYICELVDTQGNVIGEGRGTAKAYVDGKDFQINKQVKIAEKRAQIDAVLRTGGLSDFFTQDMEDEPDQSDDPPRKNMATDKQIKAIYETAARLTGFEQQEDLDKWLQKAVQGKPQQFSVKAAGAVLSKLFEAEKRQKADGAALSRQPLDVVITDIPDEITLEDVPY
jgi:hypothetical protein